MYLSSKEQIFKGEDHNYLKDLMIAINESPNIEAMLSRLEQLAERARSTASDAMRSLINLARSSARRAQEFLDDHTELKVVVTTVLADITGAVTGFYTARSNPRFALFAAAASAVYSSYTAADSALKRR